MGTCDEQDDADDREKERHECHEPPGMIPRNESACACGGTPALRFDGGAISRTHFFGTLFAAHRAVGLRKEAITVGAFVQVTAVELRIVRESAKCFSHDVIPSFRLC